MALTEKMKAFAREYYQNGGNGTEAYLTAYNTDNRVTASREAWVLLQRDDISDYIKTLNLHSENKAISEREKKRSILWDRINHCIEANDDNAVARYMDILNKMDSEYINQTHIQSDNKTAISGLDTATLQELINKK